MIEETIMTTELITAFGAAIAVIIGAIGALWVKLRSLNQHLNSRLDLLIDTVREKAFTEGGAAERARATGEAKLPESPGDATPSP